MNMLAVAGLKHLKDMYSYSNTTLSMESNAEIASRLKFIGHIQRNEKINVRHVNRQPNNWITSVSRTVLFPDTRANAFRFVRDVIYRSFDIIENYIRSNNIIESKSMITDLIKAEEGLLNMKQTYIEDTKFCCDMDVLIESIKTKIVVLREQYPIIFINENEPEKKE
jgi:hypothetical protein